MLAPLDTEMDREYAAHERLTLARADTTEIFRAAVAIFPLTGGLDGGCIETAIDRARAIWLAVHR